ncbi:O-antigen ligase family protein [Bacillus sp. sid0103]|uniref:O-antigen ligase family protein n=1 Tax=Bacillus sp. sid0103 TaxID=2856337 RepID=UPI001C496171|nr:O-antigen ligase family protein [Bacillus sp. sid0103]MBV7504122.1 O-antigen ligase family protein [Bacillus sp. sid0103]
MSKRNMYLLLTTLLGSFIGFLFFIFMNPLNIQVTLILVGLILLPATIYYSFVHLYATSLFILFCSFGFMNTSLKLFDLLFVIVALIFFILKKQKLKVIKELILINYALLLFIVVSLLSLLNSNEIQLGFSYFIHTLFMVIIFYFLALTIQTKKEFSSIIWGYVTTVLISTFAVIFQKSGLIGDIGTWFQGVRAQGFFIDPNDFSPFLILAIVILIEKAFSYHYFSFKFFTFCFLAGTVILTLLASMSRAALLNLTIVLLIYFFYSVFYKKKYVQTVMLLLPMLLLAIILIMVSGDSIMTYLSIRFSGSADLLQTYDIDRFYYQRQGILVGSTHLFGIGPGQFEYIFGYATHNLFVRIIAENGWIALLAFIAVLLYILILLVYYRKKEVWNIPVYLFLSVFIGMIINSFFLDTLHWRYLWFYLGLCTILLNQVVKKQKKEKSDR